MRAGILAFEAVELILDLLQATVIVRINALTDLSAMRICSVGVQEAKRSCLVLVGPKQSGAVRGLPVRRGLGGGQRGLDRELIFEDVVNIEGT